MFEFKGVLMNIFPVERRVPTDLHAAACMHISPFLYVVTFLDVASKS